ncbi:hypothetical protein Drose_06900 [Dactylosporangium roseum]|uniref:Transcriptional regulator n=1 Tax=Dactylosporangium roseum TaxID=47989 RepID=A0ABY5ZAG7_9ACTN|nr:hypothetical protein [Dactylosporangium roseum]UWZ37993.1 hypothetical protein Drose_06900 [Dactylosporangium roseum]
MGDVLAVHSWCSYAVQSRGKAEQVDVVDEWTGRRAALLRRALRLTNERFAERLGTAIRTVAKWNAEPAMVPTPDMQHALDTLLTQSSDGAKARFAMLLTSEIGIDDGSALATPREATAAELRLAADRNIGAALDWLDRAAGWSPGTARIRVATRLDDADPRALQDRGHGRGRVRQRVIAEALGAYYGQSGDYRPYAARTESGSLVTSILTRPDWLDLSLPLDTDGLRFAPATEVLPEVDAAAGAAAVQRLAEVLTLNMMLVNAPIYRLTEVEASSTGLSGTVALADFVGYALTMDLLENELIDALAEGRPVTPGHLPLRDRHLPDVAAVCGIGRRLCAGGPLALTAIARPGGRRRQGGDYLLLVQERSGRVLNSSRRLAVIPKAFHEPLVDYGDDAAIGATLEREMEEELFGRTDVDSTSGEQRHADPMHPSRLSEPMRWLLDRLDGGHWRMECTGLGFNLVSGNYEFASLIVIEDEEWWGRFGGSVEANWESDTLRRYSSRDRGPLDALAHDAAWSNEGLFALLQGFRRLAVVGGARTDLPAVEWEF